MSAYGMVHGVMVIALDSRSTDQEVVGGFDSPPFHFHCNDSGQVVHTHVPLSLTKQCNFGSLLALRLGR